MTKKQRIIASILEDEKGSEDFARIAKRITTACKPVAKELQDVNPHPRVPPVTNNAEPTDDDGFPPKGTGGH